jgi:ethanolamine utilization cobalamin adenosyltransferase
MMELTPIEKPQESVQRPSNQYFLQEYRIEIEFMARGCVISVGCKKIPFESVEEAMKELNEYVKNTYDVQQKWRNLLP